MCSKKFIKTCLYYYGLDPCHYFSSPGLSWNAMLKMTGIELELINDIDMHLIIEKGMRGGISYIAKRHSKVNNKYIWTIMMVANAILLKKVCLLCIWMQIIVWLGHDSIFTIWWI